MNCMKCGRELEGDQAFCPKCLEQMAQSPVRSDVVVKLPDRQEPAPKRNVPRKKVRTPEEQITRLKKRNRWLIGAVCLLLLLNGLLTYLSIDIFRQLDVQRFLGKNYSTVETIN